MAIASLGLIACDGTQSFGEQPLTPDDELYSAGDDPLLAIDGPTGPIDYGLTSRDQTTRARTRSITGGISDINDFVGPANAHSKGAWSAAAEWPLSAIHAALLPSGQVITYGTDELGNNASGFIYDIWNPNLGLGAVAHTTLDNQTDSNTFCSAQGVLSNGLLLITGGDENGSVGGKKGDGIFQSNLFNPLTEELKPAARMSFARWYPSLIGLPNGESLILGGRAEKPVSGRSMGVSTPEIYNTASGQYRLLPGADSELFSHSWYYPRAFVGHTGRVHVARNGSKEILSLNWRADGSVRRDLKVTGQGKNFSSVYPSVMYRPGKVLMLTSDKGARLINISGEKATMSDTTSPGLQRIFSDTTVMANGRVLLTGGSSTNQNLASAHYKAQIWYPGSGKWRTVAASGGSREITPLPFHITASAQRHSTDSRWRPAWPGGQHERRNLLPAVLVQKGRFRRAG